MIEPTSRTSRDAACAQLAASAVAFSFGVTPQEVVAPTRASREAAFARQVAMYLAHIAFGLPLTRVAHAFGRDRSTAAYACHRVEDERDDRAFDTCLDQLEACLRAAPWPGGDGEGLA
ncbi:helix-turn-helix domain-containing protein [Maricaulis sp.]|uniref:helix-turn-helix domain-containing protein n=1 Tax=Maricaulis sp. TaxID=1486257 RepID=UPI00262BE5D5|nr:helix-turn-helix domain-containing protein [Maricaulis sp.]